MKHHHITFPSSVEKGVLLKISQSRDKQKNSRTKKTNPHRVVPSHRKRLCLFALSLRLFLVSFGEKLGVDFALVKKVKLVLVLVM